MALVLLDTTVLIDLLRGRDGARTRLAGLRAAGDTPYVCAVNVEEAVRGLAPGERDAAHTLFSGLHVARLGSAEARQAGEWRRDLAEKGQRLTQADCLVAAAALAIGGRLATGNPADFPLPGLQVEHWPAGA
jgi:predicted nucleic acid-binding protein